MWKIVGLFIFATCNASLINHFPAITRSVFHSLLTNNGISFGNNASVDVKAKTENEEKTCAPPLGDACIDIMECPFFTELLDKTPIPRPRIVAKIIKDHQCSDVIKTTPKVCCFTHRTAKENLPATTTTTTTTTTTPSVPPRPHREPVFVDSDLKNHPNYKFLPLDQCGLISHQGLQNRITSGQNAALEEFPWMALIVYNTPGIGIEFRCAGTIIHKYYLLTAAHCVFNTTVGVRLGEYDVEHPGQDCEDQYCSPPVQDLYIKDFNVHPQYNSHTWENDIAILRLNKAANFSRSNIRPICLPVQDISDDLTGKFAIVAGWGTTEDGHKSSILRKTFLPVLPAKTCQDIYGRYYPISESKQICAGGYKGRDSCGGDSGGPLISAGVVDGAFKSIQYGIVSFGHRDCGLDGQPAVYTRVKEFMPWVLDNIGEE